MKVLIGCEESQTVCKAFRRLGHEAFSCDILPCSGSHPEWHLHEDVFSAIIKTRWDLIILHPPCTYTALCGNRWYSKTQQREEGINLCANMWKTAKGYCKKVVLEQPKTIMQRYIGSKAQVIHPWMFGHLERKETWLWLYGVHDLKPTNDVKTDMEKLSYKEQNKIWYMSPSKNRRCKRSKTYQGIADAMADQWGKDY